MSGARVLQFPRIGAGGNRDQIVASKGIDLAALSIDDPRPPLGRNAVALPPFADGLGLGADPLGERIGRAPASDDILEALRCHNRLIGPPVLKIKRKRSRDGKEDLYHDCKMARASDFLALFIARTKEARKRTGRSQTDMATILGIKQDRYKQYETRSPLSHEFIAAFCLATNVTEHWLFTGRKRRIAGAEVVDLAAERPERERRTRT
jgi:DNA-binding XRE family transcriptional regulator